MSNARYNPWVHRLALATALATFPLIFMGGLVTSHGAGMSVPDWPNSFGYNMWLFPPRLWIGGILYEHTHRLMGTLVGMLAIALVTVAWWPRAISNQRPSRLARWLAISVLGAVILQGILGGLRVVLIKLNLAMIHACIAQAVFCLTALTCIATSRWWTSAPDFSRTEDGQQGRRLLNIAAFAWVCIFAQLVIASIMRHSGAGLAIPDLPLAYGQLLPPTSQAELDAINRSRVLQLHLDPVTLGQIWLHFAHRCGAVVVSAAVATLFASVLLYHRARRELVRPAWILAGLIVAQVTLGILTVALGKPADIASAHVAVGALCLLTTFVIAVRAWRLYAMNAVPQLRSIGILETR